MNGYKIVLLKAILCFIGCRKVNGYAPEYVASGCYCYIYRRDKPRLLIAHPLLMLEPFLPEDRFKRVHRSYIVNLYEVDGFIGKALCIGKNVFPVSPSYRTEIFECFDFWDIVRRKKGQEGKDL